MTTALTQDEIIEQFKEIHGVDKYDYSKVEYINNSTKVVIICKHHGEFLQKPLKHKAGQGCKKCSIIRRTNIRRSAQDEIIEQFKEVHNNKYDYSKVDYVNNITKVVIICNHHGEFEQTPSAHKIGGGCRKCAATYRGNMRKPSRDEVIRDCMNVHGNIYEYGDIVYIDNRGKMNIICKRHGEFQQSINDHKSGRGCPQCAAEHRGNMRRIPQDEIIKQFKEIHGDTYDYSKVEYINSETTVTIICKQHGEYLQTPSAHKNSKGCKKCSTIHRIANSKISQDDVIEQFKKIHGDTYDYSKVVYINTKTPVTIVCKTHGKFSQTPGVHKTGSGCNQCSIIETANKSRHSKDYIIEQFKKIHGDTYDYSEVEYVNNSTKVIIGCKIHGNFLQAPCKHQMGRGCTKCGIIAGSLAAGITRKGSISPKRLTTEQFITDARKIHGDKYDYRKVEYITTNTPVIIICNKHGEFLQTPSKHKIGRGCHLCSNGKQSSNGQLQWLESLGKELIYEYRIPENKLRPVDGYDPITNTIYQFHGDYFHGNPEVFSPHDFNKLLKKTYGELYEKSNRLDNELRSYGYNLVIMWENDWEKR